MCKPISKIAHHFPPYHMVTALQCKLQGGYRYTYNCDTKQIRPKSVENFWGVYYIISLFYHTGTGGNSLGYPTDEEPPLPLLSAPLPQLKKVNAMQTTATVNITAKIFFIMPFIMQNTRLPPRCNCKAQPQGYAKPQVCYRRLQ